MPQECEPKDIELMLFDVDGVLTDNGLYIDEAGRMSKRFCIIDGAGIKLAQYAGIRVGLISGHDSEATRARARALGIDICHTGVHNKLPVFEQILRDEGLAPHQVSYMGDDFVDATLLKLVGMPMTVPEAPPEIRDLCRFISTRAGGNGAVRDAIEYILRQSNRLAMAIERFQLA